MLGIFLALLSPLFWAGMNITDKYVVSHKVRWPIPFGINAGFIHALTGIVVLLIMRPSSYVGWLLPFLAGVLIGLQFYLYYPVMQREDAGHAIGLFYAYPIVVAIASYALLGERLSPLAYVGMCIAVIGALLVTMRLRTRLAIWLTLGLILTSAAFDLLAKAATTSFSVWQSFGLNELGVAVALLPMLLFPVARSRWRQQLPLLPWAFLIELFALGGILSIYGALALVPVTAVSAIGTLQPLFVIAAEWALLRAGVRITRDAGFRKKLVGVGLVVVGVAVVIIAA